MDSRSDHVNHLVRFTMLKVAFHLQKRDKIAEYWLEEDSFQTLETLLKEVPVDSISTINQEIGPLGAQITSDRKFRLLDDIETLNARYPKASGMFLSPKMTENLVKSLQLKGLERDVFKCLLNWHKEGKFINPFSLFYSFEPEYEPDIGHNLNFHLFIQGQKNLRMLGLIESDSEISEKHIMSIWFGRKVFDAIDEQMHKKFGERYFKAFEDFSANSKGYVDEDMF